MLYQLTPDRYKRKIRSLLLYAGSKRKPKNFFNTAFIFSLIIGLAAGALVSPYFVFMFPGLFIGVFVLAHGVLILAVDKRARFVENILPDALQLMAANSRAGYIPNRALILSARKEFGPLCDEIKRAGKEMMTGKSLEEAISLIPRYIKSDILEKTVKLIIEGGRSGGNLANLLEENAEDIRRTQVLQKEVRANVFMYIIFIGFAGAVAAPVLYSLSGFLINTISNIGSSVVIPETVFTKIPFLKFGGLDLDPGFLFFFSIAAIFITTFFGGILIGSIASGSEKAGVKYVPIFMIIAFAIYFASNSFIQGLFGVLIPGGG